MAFHYSPKIVTNGLVLALDGANKKSYPGSGTTWTDLSGNGNTGTLVNGVGFDGGNGGSIVFDGVNDYISLDRSTTYDFTNNQSFTISGWFNITQVDGSCPYVGKWGTNSNSTGGYQLWVGSGLGNNRVAFSVANGGATAATTALMTYTFGVWNYFVGVYHANTKLECYLNDTGYQTVSYTSPINNPAVNFKIGKADYGTQTFTGKSSSVLLYNKALSSQEILQNYNATKGRFGL